MEKIKYEKNGKTRHRTAFFKGKIINFKNFNRFLFALAIIMGIFYIAGINDLAIQGYALSELKEQRNKIANENKKLELKATTLSSFNVVSEKISNLKMVAVGEIDYISGAKETVAKK